MKTTKDWLTEIRREMMNDLQADRASLLLNQSSALLGTVIEDWVVAEMVYNRYFADLAVRYEKITEAKVISKASQEYENKLLAEGLIDPTRELINSLKVFIKVKLAEQKETSY